MSKEDKVLDRVVSENIRLRKENENLLDLFKRMKEIFEEMERK